MSGHTKGTSKPSPPQPGACEKYAGLYIHIPFCMTKCDYCSFTSYAVGKQPSAGYLSALHGQAAVTAEHYWARQHVFESLFVGGGTPTIYGRDELAKLVATCLDIFRFREHPEVTVEANPNTVSREGLIALREAGVNRLSLGVQSFSDKVLTAIGRSHSAAEAEKAIETARAAGFDNINLDLMYGLPCQSLTDWRETLAVAVSHAPEHIALYELMVEEGTEFFKRAESGGLDLPDEDLMTAMEDETRGLLREGGFQQYEISNFSKTGRECVHNRNYWRNGSYMGLGAGAVSCLSGVRIRNVLDPELFTRLVSDNILPFLDAECLSLEARFRETVIMGLRMLAGVSIEDLERRFGLTPEGYYGPVLAMLHKQGLVETVEGSLRLTETGLPVGNQVLARLV